MLANAEIDSMDKLLPTVFVCSGGDPVVIFLVSIQPLERLSCYILEDLIVQALRTANCKPFSTHKEPLSFPGESGEKLPATAVRQRCQA